MPTCKQAEVKSGHYPPPLFRERYAKRSRWLTTVRQDGLRLSAIDAYGKQSKDQNLGIEVPSHLQCVFQ
jgi:hypothetical protein